MDYFLGGYNCSQATAGAFAEQLGIEPDAVFAMMAGFGGGRGGLRETCGAVSAMTFVAGLACGRHQPDDRTAKKALYDMVKAMDAAFVALHGTTCCRELLRKASCEPKPDPALRTDEYYSTRPCARFVQSAARIIEAHLDAERRDAR